MCIGFVNTLGANWSSLKNSHGALSPAILATPQIAARTVAEAMLLREEYRWARDLDGADPNANLAGQLPAQAIAITISVNGIQQQTFTLGDASKAVVVTQLVLDDGVVAVPVGQL